MHLLVGAAKQGQSLRQRSRPVQAHDGAPERQMCGSPTIVDEIVNRKRATPSERKAQAKALRDFAEWLQEASRNGRKTGEGWAYKVASNEATRRARELEGE